MRAHKCNCTSKAPRRHFTRLLGITAQGASPIARSCRSRPYVRCGAYSQESQTQFYHWKTAPPPLAARLPNERVVGAIQDLSAPSTNLHDRRDGRGIQLVRRQSCEKLALDRDDAHLRVVTAQADGSSTDDSLLAEHRLLHAGDGERDESLRTKAETGEPETTHLKAITWDVVPFGVCLKRLAQLHDR